MEFDLAGTKDGISERFAPEQDAGRLIEAEHVARYRWAAQIAESRVVLDAGCGTGYGTKLLAAAGARQVVGVDLAESVIEMIAPGMPDNVRLETADLRNLAFADDSFELIVCFEVIEHFTDPDVVLDELVRVLAPGGALLISSPNRGVFPAGNPHHFHEYQPEELRAALSARWANVRLLRQHDYLMSATLADDSFLSGDGASVEQLRVDKLIGDKVGHELYTLAIASDGELPELGQLAVLTGTLEFREWLSVFDGQTKAINEKDQYIEELRARLAEHDELERLLVDAEQRTAELPTVRLQISDLQYELAGARVAEAAVREQMRGLEARLMRSQQTLVDVMGSPSWRVTKPLRVAKKLLRS